LRKLPDTARESINVQNKTLNLTRLPDCLTRQELIRLSELDCVANPNGKAYVRFSEALNPLLILGYSDVGYPLFRKGISKGNQKKDILLEFTCPNRWSVYEAVNYNGLTQDDFDMMIVDPETCFVSEETWKSKNALEIQLSKKRFAQVVDKMLRTSHNAETTWARVQFTIFSLLVSSSFFADYNIATFYTGVTIGAGAAIRLAFLMNSYK